MIPRLYLLLLRAWYDWRIRRHTKLLIACHDNRAQVLAQLATIDEDEIQMWDRQ